MELLYKIERRDIRLMASFPVQPGKPVPGRLCQSEAGDDGVAVASSGPYADHLHLAPDR